MRHLKHKHQALNGHSSVNGNGDGASTTNGGDPSRRGPGELCVMATGGGAYKYYDMIRDVLGIDVLREDEMECLIIGTEESIAPALCRGRLADLFSPAQALISSSPKFPVRSSRTPKPTRCTLCPRPTTSIPIS